MSVGINAALAATSWGAWLLKSPFRAAIDAAEGLMVNWLVNRGLIVLNIQAITVDGNIDQAKLDSALDEALNKIRMGRDKVTPEQGKVIDDAVRKAFDKDADLGATNAGFVSDVPSAPLRSGNHPPV